MCLYEGRLKSFSKMWRCKIHQIALESHEAPSKSWRIWATIGDDGHPLQITDDSLGIWISPGCPS
eukprot:8233589-Pyramimonas_sp.AAC.1